MPMVFLAHGRTYVLYTNRLSFKFYVRVKICIGMLGTSANGFKSIAYCADSFIFALGMHGILNFGVIGVLAMQLDGEKRVEEELVEWGNWSRCTGLSLSLNESGFVHVGITDDRALEIDRIVGILAVRDPRAARVLKYRFIERVPLALIAKRLDVSRPRATTVLDMGIACVGIGLGMTASNDDVYDI